MRRSPLRKQQANAAPIDIGAHGTNTRPYEPLTPAQVARLITEAIALMGDVGIRFEPGSEADQLLAAAGCSVCPDGVIRFPAALVRAALASCAKGTKIWNRAGDTGITIDTEHTWFMPGMTCIRIIDPVSGKTRDSTRDDLALITRIADGLPNIDAVCVACKDTPNSTLAGEIGEFVCLTENTTKPLEYLCEFTASLEAVIEMAALLRGGRAELAAKPYFLHLVTPLPVAYAKGHVEQILIAARAGVPVGVGTVSFGGATSPITTAGCVLHSLATDFAAMVLAQVAVPGAFCIGGSISYFMEAATGAIGSTPQVLLAEQMVCQIRRSLGLPHLTGIGGRVRARRFSQDAVWEMSAMMMQHFYTRPATCDYLGLSDNGVTYSLHGLLMGNEMAGMLRSMWRDGAVDDESMALDALRAVGPHGNFLGELHTASHCREVSWPSAYLGRFEPLSTTDLPDRDLAQRISLDLAKRINAPPPAALPEDLRAAFAEIVTRTTEKAVDAG